MKYYIKNKRKYSLYDVELNKLSKKELKKRYLILRNNQYNSYKFKKELYKLIEYLNKNNIDIFDDEI